MNDDTHPTPPRLPSELPSSNCQRNNSPCGTDPVKKMRWSARMEKDYAPLDAQPSLLHIIDTLLKRPACVAYEITHERRSLFVGRLLMTAALGICAYGLIMGTFCGGHQLWFVPIKTIVGFLLGSLLCLPSLYIFAALAGGRQSLCDAVSVLVATLAFCALLMLGFAPISWIFAQSTTAALFMGVFHLVFFGIAIRYALEFLLMTLAFLNKEDMGVIKVWGVILIVVMLQMCTTLRPLVGEFDGFRLQPKQFFLANWIKTAGDSL